MRQSSRSSISQLHSRADPVASETPFRCHSTARLRACSLPLSCPHRRTFLLPYCGSPHQASAVQSPSSPRTSQGAQVSKILPSSDCPSNYGYSRFAPAPWKTLTPVLTAFLMVVTTPSELRAQGKDPKPPQSVAGPQELVPIPPSIEAIAKTLESMHQTRTASALRTDFQQRRVTLSDGLGEDNASTGHPNAALRVLRVPTDPKENVMELNRTNVNTHEPLSLALTVVHEYVHMGQSNPIQTKQYEDAAWRETIKTSLKWMVTVRDAINRSIDAFADPVVKKIVPENAQERLAIARKLKAAGLPPTAPTPPTAATPPVAKQALPASTGLPAVAGFLTFSMLVQGPSVETGTTMNRTDAPATASLQRHGSRGCFASNHGAELHRKDDRSLDQRRS